MYDCIVVGCGVAGAVVAREIAEKGHKKVLVIEERDHVGGNCYDERDAYGILIHTYGPHIFHTKDKEVYEYLSRFTQWLPYHHKVVANIEGNYIPVPFNLNSMKIVYGQEEGERLGQKFIMLYGKDTRVPILDLMKSEDEDIKKVAQYVYENVFLKYTMKQWGKRPEEIDLSVTKRVPVVLTDQDGYFSDAYQGMPKDGYTVMFEKMLDHPDITVRLNMNAKSVLRLDSLTHQIFYKEQPFSGQVIYTGPLDRWLDSKYGRLPYRSLEFQFEHYEQPFYQCNSVVNYTVSEDYTRVTEFKYMTGQEGMDTTTIVKEYPKPYNGSEDDTPYYAINNEENNALYEKYKHEIEQYNNVYVLGRLAEYKYYNIDAIVRRALDLTKELL